MTETIYRLFLNVLLTGITDNNLNVLADALLDAGLTEDESVLRSLIHLRNNVPNTQSACEQIFYLLEKKSGKEWHIYLNRSHIVVTSPHNRQSELHDIYGHRRSLSPEDATYLQSTFSSPQILFPCARTNFSSKQNIPVGSIVIPDYPRIYPQCAIDLLNNNERLCPAFSTNILLAGLAFRYLPPSNPHRCSL